MAENFYVAKENVFIDRPSTPDPAIYNVYFESGGVCRGTKQGRKDIEITKTSVVLSPRSTGQIYPKVPLLSKTDYTRGTWRWSCCKTVPHPKPCR